MTAIQLKYHQATLDLLIHSQNDLQKFVQNQAGEILRLSGDAQQKRGEIARHRRWLLHWQMFIQALEKPTISQTNLQQLNAVERRYGIVLPASVREWYSLNFVPHLMAIRWPEKVPSPAPITHFRSLTILEFDATERHHHDLWVFMFYEFFNQGGDEIAFKIDAGDDPPVFAEADEEIFDLSPLFSEFIFLFFVDWIVDRTFKYRFTLSVSQRASSIPVRPIRPQGHILSLDDLRQHYQEQRGNWKTRFYDEDLQIRVFIRQGELSTAEFRARTLNRLAFHISAIWGKDAPVFQMQSDHQNSKVMLRAMRGQHLLKTLQTLNGWISAGELATYFGCSVDEILRLLEPLVESQAINAHFENKPWLPHTQRYRKALSLR